MDPASFFFYRDLDQAGNGQETVYDFASSQNFGRIQIHEQRIWDRKKRPGTNKKMITLDIGIG